MEHKLHLSTFSQAEDSFLSRFQRMRDVFFRPVSAFLTKIGVKANHLSYLTLLIMVPFVYFLNKNPLISFLAGLSTLILDALDGCLARYQKTESERGALLDIGVDHFVLFTVVLSLIYAKTIDGFWGAAYAVNYLLMISLVMAMRSLKLHVFPVVRSKYYLYLFWVIFIFTGLNYLDILLVFFSIYMFLTNLFLFHKLRCSLP